MIKTILLTGFEPFGIHNLNPSWEGIKPLHGQSIGGFVLRSLLLPVLYTEAPRLLKNSVLRENPAAVISFGACRGEMVRLERLARNRTGSLADNGGSSLPGPIVAGGAETLSTTLPLADIEAALSLAGFSSEYSDDAGDYLCNHIFYSLREDAAIPCTGFIHLPPLSAAFEPAAAAAAVYAAAAAVAAFLQGQPAFDNRLLPLTL